MIHNTGTQILFFITSNKRTMTFLFLSSLLLALSLRLHVQLLLKKSTEEKKVSYFLCFEAVFCLFYFIVYIKNYLHCIRR